MAILVVVLPLLATSIQSSWIVLLRGTDIYQALLHPDNYSPVWLVLGGEAAITAIVLWPCLRNPVLQRVVAMLLLAGFVYYDFAINMARERW